MVDAVLFVSLGSGDPQLITLKGLKALQNADLVFCPCTHLPRGEITSRAKDILLQLNIDEGKIRLFNVPMSKNRSLAIEAYYSVSEMVVGHYQEGLKIAITSEGDAGFYSSVHYVKEILDRHNIPSLKIAGIPAFIACGAFANLHIAQQEKGLSVIPGMVTLDVLDVYLQQGQSVVVMKASQCEKIIKHALDVFPNVTFHYFENVGIVGKEYYTSDKNEIRSLPFPYFSLIIIQTTI